MDQSAAARTYPPLRSGFFTLAVLVIAFIVAFIDRQVLALLVDPIKASLAITDFQMSLLLGFAFALFYCLLGIPVGRLADRRSRKMIIAVGVLMWSAATMACGFASSFAALFLFRILVGVGEAALTPAGYSLLGDTFPPYQLARATTLFVLGGMYGAGLALLLGGQVIAYANANPAAPFGLAGFEPWQATFIIVGAPGAVVAALCLMITEPARHRDGEGTGAGFRSALATLWSLRRGLAPLYLAGAGMAIVSYGGLAFFATHLIRTFALGPGDAGFILGLTQLAGASLGGLIGVLLTEYLLRRHHCDAHLRTVIFAACGTLLTLFAPIMPTLGGTVGVWLAATLFQNAYYGSTTAALQIITPRHLRATNSALFLLFTTLGGLGVGTALIGLLSDHLFPGMARGIGYSLMLVSAMAAGFAILVGLRGLRGYRVAAAPLLTGQAAQ